MIVKMEEMNGSHRVEPPAFDIRNFPGKRYGGSAKATICSSHAASRRRPCRAGGKPYKRGQEIERIHQSTSTPYSGVRQK